MNQLANPSITSPRAGAPGRNRSPQDVTGRKHAEQLREKAARDAAKNIDIPALKRAEFRRGFEEGYAKGLEAGWDALAAHLVAEGILDPDEEPADADAEQE